MTLKAYRKKRDFSKTPEPRGRKAPSGNGPERRYLIQKHAASRLHYDFRLELDGALKSWAVPKGPSLDPGEKRLAVHVEDHPLEYGEFEGVIPEGEYGGGTVMLWDRGIWQPEGDAEKDYARGRLSFELCGEKLKGRWSLVRMSGSQSDEGKNWLLVKGKDEFAQKGSGDRLLDENDLSVATGRTMEAIAADAEAVWQGGAAVRKDSSGPAADGLPDPARLPGARQAKMPHDVRPQLPTLVSDPPTGEIWLHEIKYDGYRIIAMVSARGARLITRNGKDWTDRFPSVAEDLARAIGPEAVIDMEIVVQRPDGTTDFQALQNVLQGVEEGKLVCFLFDVLHFGGYDLSATPLGRRKDFLKRLLDALPSRPPTIRYSDHVQGSGDRVYQHACRLVLEGIVSKRSDRPYQEKRTREWLKVKCQHRQEFVIGGYTEPSGSRNGFGALLLGVYDENRRLIYCGKVGTGFNEAQLQTLKQQMAEMERETPPFLDPPTGAQVRKVHWITPQLVAEVEFTAWTEDGMLRHPSFKGIREDKAAAEVRRETMLPGPQPAEGNRVKRRPRATADAGGRPRVRLTHPDRILFPEQGVTKKALAGYYERIAGHILPHVAHRPLSLLRCPQGRNADCFFQKHFTESVPDPLRAIQIREKDKTRPYLVLDDLDGLLGLVQLGVLEIHLWNARDDRIKRPDRLIIDLDPDAGVGLQAVVEATALVHDFLAEIGLTSFIKTSGGKGFHVVAPLVRRTGWDELKAFAKGVAVTMAQRHPERFVATASKKKRAGKIFLDYLRNGRGATSVAPFSTRARPGAPVSAPIRRDELAAGLTPGAYRIDNIEKRLRALQNDPWQGFFDLSQSITRSMKEAVGMHRQTGGA